MFGTARSGGRLGAPGVGTPIRMLRLASKQSLRWLTCSFHLMSKKTTIILVLELWSLECYGWWCISTRWCTCLLSRLLSHNLASSSLPRRRRTPEFRSLCAAACSMSDSFAAARRCSECRPCHYLAGMVRSNLRLEMYSVASSWTRAARARQNFVPWLCSVILDIGFVRCSSTLQ